MAKQFSLEHGRKDLQLYWELHIMWKYPKSLTKFTNLCFIYSFRFTLRAVMQSRSPGLTPGWPPQEICMNLSEPGTKESHSVDIQDLFSPCFPSVFLLPLLPWGCLRWAEHLKACNPRTASQEHFSGPPTLFSTHPVAQLWVRLPVNIFTNNKCAPWEKMHWPWWNEMNMGHLPQWVRVVKNEGLHSCGQDDRGSTSQGIPPNPQRREPWANGDCV